MRLRTLPVSMAGVAVAVGFAATHGTLAVVSGSMSVFRIAVPDCIELRKRVLRL